MNTKFRALTGRVLPKERIERALDLLWKLDEAPDLRGIFNAVQIPGN